MGNIKVSPVFRRWLINGVSILLEMLVHELNLLKLDIFPTYL